MAGRPRHHVQALRRQLMETLYTQPVDRREMLYLLEDLSARQARINPRRAAGPDDVVPFEAFYSKKGKTLRRTISGKLPAAFGFVPEDTYEVEAIVYTLVLREIEHLAKEESQTAALTGQKPRRGQKKWPERTLAEWTRVATDQIPEAISILRSQMNRENVVSEEATLLPQNRVAHSRDLALPDEMMYMAARDDAFWVWLKEAPEDDRDLILLRYERVMASVIDHRIHSAALLAAESKTQEARAERLEKAGSPRASLESQEAAEKLRFAQGMANHAAIVNALLFGGEVSGPDGKNKRIEGLAARMERSPRTGRDDLGWTLDSIMLVFPERGYSRARLVRVRRSLGHFLGDFKEAASPSLPPGAGPTRPPSRSRRNPASSRSSWGARKPRRPRRR